MNKKTVNLTRLKNGIVLGFIIWVPPKDDECDPEEGEWGLWHAINEDNEHVDFNGIGGFIQCGFTDQEFQEFIKRIAPQLKKRTIANKLRFRILKRDKFKCQYCGVSAKEGAELEIDHKIPKSKGGTDKESNLVTSCKECNRGKGTKI